MTDATPVEATPAPTPAPAAPLPAAPIAVIVPAAQASSPPAQPASPVATPTPAAPVAAAVPAAAPATTSAYPAVESVYLTPEFWIAQAGAVVAEIGAIGTAFHAFTFNSTQQGVVVVGLQLAVGLIEGAWVLGRSIRKVNA